MTTALKALILACIPVALLSADTLTLRDGEVIQGTYLGGTSRQIRMDLNGEIRTFDLGQVQSITFSNEGAYQAPVSPVQPPAQPGAPRSANYPPPPSSPNYPQARSYPSDEPRLRRAPGADAPSYPSSSSPASPAPIAGIVIPLDTPITIRMIDSVDSDRARLGETFRASIDEPVVVGNQEVIPRGADVLTKLVTDQRSGSLRGQTVLTLALSTVTVNGRPVDVTSTDVRTASTSRGQRTAGAVGGGAALGAIIGAIAGGGKGAAIGAASGGALGAGAEVVTGGQKVRIPSETRLTFRLQSPVTL